MSTVRNAPVTPNNGGYEQRTAESKHLACKTDGQNSGGFETRVTQEQGTH
jgi:hypothetical protein